MIDHASTYATNFMASRDFYDATLATLGFNRVTNMVTTWDPTWPERNLCAYGPPGQPIFWLVEVREAATPRHVGFQAKGEEAIKAWYAAGLAHGGKDNGAPGPRTQYHPGYYAAFLIDPDGNNVEAVNHGAGH